MAKSVNKVILLGNLGKDPEIKFLPSGQAVANFGLATTERYKDKAGEWQDKTEWHNITAYGRQAEIIRDYVKKGHKLFIEGRLTTRSWDDKDTGKKVYRTEVVVSDLSLLSGRGDGEGGGGGSYGGSRGASGSGSSGGYDQRPAAPVQDDYGDTGITDDDIPF
jgi:single-strand DNA-binding protein